MRVQMPLSTRPPAALLPRLPRRAGRSASLLGCHQMGSNVCHWRSPALSLQESACSGAWLPSESDPSLLPCCAPDIDEAVTLPYPSWDHQLLLRKAHILLPEKSISFGSSRRQRCSRSVMGCVPPHSHVGALPTPSCDGTERWGLWEVIREGDGRGALVNGISAPERVRGQLALCHVDINREVSSLQPRRGPSADLDLLTLISGCRPPGP